MCKLTYIIKTINDHPILNQFFMRFIKPNLGTGPPATRLWPVRSGTRNSGYYTAIHYIRYEASDVTGKSRLLYRARVVQLILVHGINVNSLNCLVCLHTYFMSCNRSPTMKVLTIQGSVLVVPSCFGTCSCWHVRSGRHVWFPLFGFGGDVRLHLGEVLKEIVPL